MAGVPSGPRTIVGYEPGADAAARYPDWVIRHRPLRGIPEVLCLERKVILIDNSGNWAEKRSGLAHAIAHLDHGHQTVRGHLSERQEREAEQLAAIRLIHPAALADAIRWNGERWPAVAAHLTVDVRLISVRLKHLHPVERRHLRAALHSYLIGEVA